MKFLRKDLTKDYTWARDNAYSRFTGDPSRRVFDRYSGDQVLFMINSLAALSDDFSIEDVKKMEHKISLLPIATFSEISVFNLLISEAVVN